MAETSATETLAPGTTRPGPQRYDDPHAAPAGQDEGPAHGANAERWMADAVRALAIDAVEAAGSGDAGLPIGMADVATALWTRLLRFDATDPRWPDRDRFVLSAGSGAMLLYALLHLTGHAGMEEATLRHFRQLDSPCAGTPEYGDHPAIEATTGPLGQGLATAVGLALAERMLAARFGRSLVDHRTWVIAADAELMAGISHEAAGLAGQLQLEKLTVLWQEAPTPAALSPAEDPLKRFAAAGWTTRRIEAEDPAAIAGALAVAMRSKKPTLVACRTRSDPGTATAARQTLGWPHEAFAVPEALRERWQRAGVRGTAARRAWLKRLANHPLRSEFERVTAGRLPESWHEATAALKTELAETRPLLATGASSHQAIAALAAAVPELVGGEAGTARPVHLRAATMAAVGPGSYAGRSVDFGMREHGMAACLNGMALHGGLLPFAEALLVATDSMRPALRLAAQMRQRVIHVLAHDSIGLGEDGPALQPVEHLASLRAMPGLFVLRPADAMETAEAWELAIRRSDGPSLLVLSRQAVPPVRMDAGENRCARGGYVLQEADGPRQATLVASGSEVSIAIEARRLLAEDGIPAAVVSLPCWALFAAQDDSWRAQVLGTALRVGIEAACGFGWERWLGPEGIFIGMSGYGASAPAETLYRHFGITPDAIANAVRKRLQPPQSEGL